MTQLRSLKLITYKGGSLGDPESHGGAAHRPHPTCRSVPPTAGRPPGDMSSWVDVHREVWEQVPYSFWPAGISTGWSVPSSQMSSILGSHRQNVSHDLEALDYTMDPGYCLARPNPSPPDAVLLQGQPQESK